jgi:hypothetical protein
LLGDELDELIGQATINGHATSCTTNGYWAVNEKAARERMQTAASAGLKLISLSTGEMHAKYVPVERIVNAAVAAADIGMEVAITIEGFLGTSFDWRAITEHPEIKARRPDRLRISKRSWIPNAEGKGRAKLRHSSSRGRFRKSHISGCASILNMVSVNPDQMLIACCGYPMDSIPDLHLGSVAERTIAEVLEHSEDDLLKRMIHVLGPERLLLFVKRFVPDYKLPTNYAHQCQTCLHLHRDVVAMAVLREHLYELAGELPAMFEHVLSVPETTAAGRRSAAPSFGPVSGRAFEGLTGF